MASYTTIPGETVEITTVVGCVVDCVFCPQEKLTGEYDGEKTMSLDNFKTAIDKIPSEVRVHFSGMAEPWLNKRCTEMLLYAHEKGHPIGIFSTVVGMTVEDVETIGNIPDKFVLHLPDSKNYMRVKITDKYLDTLRHIGTYYQSFSGFASMCMGPLHETVVDMFPDAIIQTMISRADNVETDEPHHKTSHKEGKFTCGCVENVRHAVLLPNGQVVLCCMDYGLDHVLGNLYEESYEEIVPELDSCFELCNRCHLGVSLT